MIEITRENIHNPDALWQWIKCECEDDNIESIKFETFLTDVQIENAYANLKFVKERKLTITFGNKNEHPFIY